MTRKDMEKLVSEFYEDWTNNVDQATLLAASAEGYDKVLMVHFLFWLTRKFDFKLKEKESWTAQSVEQKWHITLLYGSVLTVSMEGYLKLRLRMQRMHDNVAYQVSGRKYEK